MKKLIALFLVFTSLSYSAVISASGIIGQGSYTTATLNYPSGSINAAGFGILNSLAMDTVNHRLFVSDRGNKRILVFDLDNNNGLSATSATHVLGACNFTTAGSGALTASTFGGTGGTTVNIAFDAVNQRLFVSDGGNNRVLMFLVSPGFSDCENASAVFGQADFTSSATTVLNAPDDIALDTVNNRLLSSSQFGNTVQVFATTPGVTGGVTTTIFTLGTGSTTLAQNTLNQPVGQAYDSVNQRLFVSDLGNHRIMVFSVPSTCNSSCSGENATFVLGQPNFSTNTSGHSQSIISRPDDGTYDVVGNRYFVTDYDNNRIMNWRVPDNADASFNGANATAQIGPVSWTGGLIGTPPTQNSFSHPEAPHSYDPSNNRFLTYEFANLYRVLQVDMIHITSTSLANGGVGAPYSQTVAVSQNQGTSQTFSVTVGSLPPGLSINASTGSITGTPSVSGTYTFTVEADDNFSDGSTFFDLRQFTVQIANNSSSVAGGSLLIGGSASIR